MGRDDSRKGKSEDLDLWRQVTRDVRPLKGRPETPDAEPLAEHPQAPRHRAPAAAPQPGPAKSVPTLAPGQAAGLDKRTAERLRRGQLAIEARLDLHGLTQAEAHRALDAFIAAGQDRGRRCVLVITGKGTWRDERGVLRTEVPRWLNLPPNRSRILAFATAQPRHGGEGALYVLLKRQRA